MPQQCVYVLLEFKSKMIKNYLLIKFINKKELLKSFKRNKILVELLE